MNSIYRKLVFYFLLLNLLAISVIVSYSYYKEREALLSRTFDQLISVRIEKANRIKSFLRQRMTDVENLSMLPEFQRIISGLKSENHAKNIDESFAEQTKYIVDVLRNYPFYRSFMCFDSSKTLCSIDVKTGRLRKIDYKTDLLYRKLLNNCKSGDELFVQEIKSDDKQARSVVVVGKYLRKKQDAFSGVLLLNLNESWIDRIMFENNPNNGLNKTGEVYLVGSDTLMRSSSRFVKNSVFRIKVSTEGVKKALSGVASCSQINDYRNISVLSAYSPLNFSHLHWAVLAEIDTKEAMIPIYSIRDNIIYLSLLIALLSAAFITFISKKLSDPLVKLKNETEKIASGEYGNILDVKSADEIGELTKAFNDMSLKLRMQADNLEKEKKLRLRSVLDAQEKERQRVSRDLHDGLGPMLLIGKMKLESIVDSCKDNSKKIIEDVSVIISNTIGEIRNISNNIMPSGLKELGLKEALQNFCQKVMENNEVEIKCLIDIANKRYDKTLEIYLLRITQEAINNSIRHAMASSIHLNIEDIDNHIFLTIWDDGKGFDAERVEASGNGLSNMKERVNLLNGYFELTSEIGKGTRIDIDIPL